MAFFYLVAIPSPSRSSSRSIVSSCVSPRLIPSRVISSDEGQASKEAGRVIIIGSVSSASAPSSVRPSVPSQGSRAVITSSPHPRQASRRAGRTRQPRGVGGGVFSFKQWGGATGRCDIAIRMAFLLSRTAAIIPGAGVVPHHPSRRSPHPCLIPSSSPISKRKPGKQAGRRKRGGLDDRIPAGVGKREQASKTRTTNDQLHPHHRTGHGPNLTPNRIDRPAHPTSTQRDARRDAGTTGDDERARRTRRRRERRTDDGRARRTRRRRSERWRKRTDPARRQASNETQYETTDDKTETRRRDARRQWQKQAIRGEARRTRRTKTVSFLTFRPTPSRLFSLIRRPQLFPRPRAWEEQAMKQTRHAHLPSVASAGFYHSRPASSALARRISSSPGVISPHAPFSVAHPSMSLSPSRHAPQDAQAKRPPPPLIMASIKRPAHSTSRTRRRTERGEWRAVHDRRLDRCLDRRCSRCPPPPHRISPAWFPSWAEGGNSRGIFRAVFLSSFHPPRLIVSSIPRLAAPSQRASRRRAGIGSGIVSRSVSPFAPSRPSCRRAGRMASRSRRPARLAAPVSPVPVAGQGMALGSTPQPSRQASRQGRPVPVPPLVSAGGKPSANAPRIDPSWPRHRHGGQASKMAAVLVPSRLGPVPPHRLIRLAPSYRVAGPYHRHGWQASKAARLVRPPRAVPPIVSAPWLALGQAVNGRNGKNKTPRSPCRGTGRKAFSRSIARGYCNSRCPAYRRRYRRPVPAPGDSSRRR